MSNTMGVTTRSVPLACGYRPGRYTYGVVVPSSPGGPVGAGVLPHLAVEKVTDLDGVLR